MMKKAVAMLLCGALAAGMLVGCGQTKEAPAAPAKSEEAAPAEEKPAAEAGKEAEPAAEKKTFTVGFDAEFPPYGYQDENGEYTGFDLEMAQAVCDLEGWELVKQPIDWDSKDMELSSGAIDCIWNGFTVDGREDDYTWSDPYIDNSQVYVVAADSGIKTPADLAGKVVGVQKDSSALAALNNEENKALKDSFKELTEYADYNTAFMDLEAGGIECLAMDIGVAAYQIKSRGDGYVMLEEKLASEKYAVGFLKGNTELCAQVQKDIYQLYDEGKVKELADKYELTDFLCIENYKK